MNTQTINKFDWDKYSTWQERNEYKNGNLVYLHNELTNKVLLAAIDWQRFQSDQNAQALYLAVLKMQGLKPDIPFELD